MIVFEREESPFEGSKAVGKYCNRPKTGAINLVRLTPTVKVYSVDARNVSVIDFYFFVVFLAKSQSFIVYLLVDRKQVSFHRMC
jgi:hypothetical protein